MRPVLRAIGILTLVAVAVAGCGSGTDPVDAWARPHPTPRPVGTLGPGFVDPSSSPTPEGTITPRPGSWSDVHPSAGYRVVLLTAGDDAATAALVSAVRDWAAAEQVDLRTVTADPTDLVRGITAAIELSPDLVISAGNELVDPLALVTASNLSQQFLVVGAELAEPTVNVTAADWSGASFRGEGLGMSSTYDPASFTPDRCAAAVRAGVAAVLTGLTGIVIWLDDYR